MPMQMIADGRLAKIETRINESLNEEATPASVSLFMQPPKAITDQ